MNSRQVAMGCRTKLYGIKHKANGDLKAFISEIEVKSMMIRNTGETVDDVAILLNVMSPEFGSFVKAF